MSNILHLENNNIYLFKIKPEFHNKYLYYKLFSIFLAFECKSVLISHQTFFKRGKDIAKNTIKITLLILVHQRCYLTSHEMPSKIHIFYKKLIYHYLLAFITVTYISFFPPSPSAP